MQLFCKELKGNEISLEGVDENTQIADIKKQIESKLSIPGKPLFIQHSKFLFVYFTNIFINFSCPAKAFILRKDSAGLIPVEGLQSSRQCKVDADESIEARSEENNLHALLQILRQRNFKHNGKSFY